MCSCKHCCSGKVISITYSECVFIALEIQHAMCMHHIEICGLAPLQYLTTLSHKQHNCQLKKKKLLNIHTVCLYFLYNSVSNIYHPKKH
jgi:hypothetical protein